MNPLAELKSMVATATSIESGIVVSINGPYMSVKHKTGLKSFAIPSVGSYKAGDTVRFQGNVLLGKATNADLLPVFQV